MTDAAIPCALEEIQLTVRMNDRKHHEVDSKDIFFQIPRAKHLRRPSRRLAPN
jgi:hypothetical protein